MTIMQTNNREARPLLRGTLVSIAPDWFPGPSENEERQICVIAVWCPYCRRHHFHGWDPANDGRVAEHRNSHCHDPDSLFYRGGYYISVWRKSDPESVGHVVRPGRAIVRRVTPLAVLDRADVG